MGTTALMTVEQFAQMQTADTEDYELVEGELIRLSSGTPFHNKLRRRVERLLEDYFARNPIGEAFSEIDCRISSHTVRRPDVAVFLGAQRDAIDMKKVPVAFPPDIAIEVLSPSETAIDVNRKTLDYLSGGCQEVWLLDNVNAEIFIQTTVGIRLLRGADRVESPLLSGFSLPVSEILLSDV